MQDREFVDMDLPFNGVGITKKKGGGGSGGSRPPSPTESEQAVSCFACRCCKPAGPTDKNMVSQRHTWQQLQLENQFSLGEPSSSGSKTERNKARK